MDGLGDVRPAGSPESRARTPATEKAYEMRARQRYRLSTEMRTIDPLYPIIVTPREVVEDLVVDAGRLAPQSWNLYRAALLWHLSRGRSEAGSGAAAYASAYDLLASIRPGRTGGSSAMRSEPTDDGTPQAKKAKKIKKSIPEADLKEIIIALGPMNRTTNWGAKTQFWLQAGLASGVRPAEWLGASWQDETRTILCVPNAKLKRTAPIWQLTGSGKTIHDIEAENPELLPPGSESDPSKRMRTVPIKPNDRMYVNLHLGALNQYLDKEPGEDQRQRFNKYFNVCRGVLHKACKLAFNGEKRYSFYVMRSQYAANMKAEMPLDDVAILMGHGSTKTTKRNYAPRRAAHGGAQGQFQTTTQTTGNADRDSRQAERTRQQTEPEVD